MSGYWASVLPIFFLLFSLQSFALEFNCKPNMAHQTFPLSDGDPTKFFICEKEQGWVIKCPQGTGFLSTDKLHGCLPWEEWPNAPKDRIPSCSNGQHKRLYRHIDPRLYFACKAIDTPVLVKCPEDTAFTYTQDIVGCVLWSEWKVEKQINDE